MKWLFAAMFVLVACSDEHNCHDAPDCTTTSTSASAGGAGGQTLAEQYCVCMLTSCHDAYHAHYGPETNEPQARANCLSEAAALPVAGMDVDQGNFIECRQHYCELGKTDASVCPSSIGEDACAP